MTASNRSATVWNAVGIMALVVPVLVLLVSCGPVMNSAARASDPAARSESNLPAKDIKQAGQPEAANAAFDDDGLEVDEEITALVVPSTLMGKSKMIDRLTFSQNLRGLLMEGMTADSGTLADAKRHFEAAHHVLADDPRAPYAFGISLLAHNNSKEALEQFQAASQHAPAPFLPALQAIAWVHVLRRDYAGALPAVLDLAHKIEETKGPWPVDHDRRHSSEWLQVNDGLPGRTRKTSRASRGRLMSWPPRSANCFHANEKKPTNTGFNGSPRGTKK